VSPKKNSHVAPALIADLVLVVLFTVIGHYTHHHSLVPLEVVHTAWPFAAALAAAWLLTAAWRQPTAPLAVGTGVWAVTVLGGLLIRFFIGETNAGSFMVVAASMNFVTLVGWRAIATLIARRG
jgi:hypothetical protein